MRLILQVKWADGKKYEGKFIATLKKYGYGGKGKYMSKPWLEKPVFIQSFAPMSLIYAADLIDSPKVFLVDDLAVRTEDTDQSYDEITSEEYPDYMKEYVVGIGPWKDTVVPPTKGNRLATPTDLVAMAHARGLQVHPYTYRNENRFLHYNFKQDPYAEYDYRRPRPLHRLPRQPPPLPGMDNKEEELIIRIQETIRSV
jgi:glycerophosphoryl diester phosphodiesterase